MIWFLTKRQIVHNFHNRRWEKGLFWMDRRDRQTKGVSRKEFTGTLFIEESQYDGRIVHFLKSIYKKLKGKEYVDSFSTKVEDIIDQCIEEGYLKIKTTDCLVVTSKGRDLIRWYYFLKVLFGNAYVKTILINTIILFTLL